MRDVRNHRYEGENFAAEKVVATIWLIMFVVMVGIGAHTQFFKTAPEAAPPAAVETALNQRSK